MTWQLALFLLLVLVFHVSELWLVRRYNSEQLSFASLLLSPGYVAMLVLAIFEYELERRHVPMLKNGVVAGMGAALAVTGELIRKTAMITAGRHFTHEIAEQKRSGHVLLRTGIYRVLRHPGYFGWFLWAAGMHLLLVNPLSTALTLVGAWRFFKQRIPYEEALLLSFFPEEYPAYRARTRTFIPFIP